MPEDRSTIEEWRALVAATQQGQLQRRRLLTATDIGLLLAALIVIGALASLLISYGDDQVMGGAGARFLSASRADAASPQPQRVSPVRETAFEHAAKHMQPGYRCPQHPEVISEAPGACPICGERLRWSDAAAGADAGHIDASAVVVTGARRLKDLPLSGAGWVERLAVREVGAQVQKGDLLMEVYVPDLRTGIARQEGVVRLYSPVAGQVHAIHAQEGRFVADGAVVVQVEDSSSLWFQASVSAAEAARIDPGQRVEWLMPLDSKEAAPLGEVDELVLSPDGEGDATVWLRFDDAPALHPHPEINVRIHARAVEVGPPGKS